jgi:hypothetical protein
MSLAVTFVERESSDEGGGRHVVTPLVGEADEVGPKYLITRPDWVVLSQQSGLVPELVTELSQAVHCGGQKEAQALQRT